MSLPDRKQPSKAVLYGETNRNRSAIAWILSHIVPASRIEEIKKTNPHYQEDTADLDQSGQRLKGQSDFTQRRS